MTLEEARAEIAAIDREMAALFERRMAAAEPIADWKREHGLPVLDEAQEARVIARGAAQIENPAIRALYPDFQRGVMRLSREYQRQRMEERG
ncbi:MAG: chorismate mutase [Oscillospiraceae bacterium]|nr:chorismate mutase [Oscillospiraceae bacterium]